VSMLWSSGLDTFCLHLKGRKFYLKMKAAQCAIPEHCNLDTVFSCTFNLHER